MTTYDNLRRDLQLAPKRWLVTGVAGFIGSNLLEDLLKLDQEVVGLDNFSAGKQANLDEVRGLVSPAQWARFHFLNGDITELSTCKRACAGMDYVLHQAAIGSVPRSMLDPIRYHHSNVTGFLNMLVEARDAGVKRFVYASSSSVYGDHPALPKVEDKIGKPLSPYAATKTINEVYAGVFGTAYQFETVGLRYFNVFGPRQDPNGAYAAVIPKWIDTLLNHKSVHINGDGETSRDFCYVANVVQANLLAATAPFPLRLVSFSASDGEKVAKLDEVCVGEGGEGQGEMSQVPSTIFNIAVGERTSLNELYQLLQEGLHQQGADVLTRRPRYRDFQAGDVRHSLADISKAKALLGYEPAHRIGQGLKVAMGWYQNNAARATHHAGNAIGRAA